MISYLLIKFRIALRFTFQLLRLNVRGFHNIYLISSKRKRVLEFIGYGGKTTLLKAYFKHEKKRSSRLKKIKPTLDHLELKNSRKRVNKNYRLIIDQLTINIMDFYDSSYNYFESVQKLLIMDKYHDKGIQLWDEGIIKGSFNYFVDISKEKPHLLSNLLRNFSFVVVRPPIEVTYNRYINRSKKKLEFLNLQAKKDLHSRILESYKNLDEFITFLDNFTISHIILNGVSKVNLVELTHFINQIEENPLS